MEKQLKDIDRRLTTLENKVFGVSSGFKIKLSKEGLRQFPELRKEVFYLLRWNKNRRDEVIVQRLGKKTKESWHHDFFDI